MRRAAGLIIAVLECLTRRRHSRFNSHWTTGRLAGRLAVLVLIAFFFSCCSLTPVPVTGERPIKIVVLGDSLSAGFGLLWQAAFPERLERALRA